MLRTIVVWLLISQSLAVELKYEMKFEKIAIQIVKEVNELGVGWTVCGFDRIFFLSI